MAAISLPIRPISAEAFAPFGRLYRPEGRAASGGTISTAG